MQALKREIKKLGTLALFFLISFGYILLIVKLFLKEYSINSYELSKAIIGALVAAKAVAIVDAIPWLGRFREFPRYVSVLYRTFLYTLAVIAIGIVERLIHVYIEKKAIAAAISSFLEPQNLYHFFAVILCIAVVFLIHNILKEIDIYLGEGTTRKFFFSRPRTRKIPLE
jgi:uncharacterized SAM-binding protein YcdF (DUF218 family)